jgi:chromosome segregation ATPase
MTFGVSSLVSYQRGEWIEAACAEIVAARLARSPTTSGSGLMSTAGKVLVVSIMVAILAWLILAGGVARLNRNGNEALKKLTDEVAKAQADLQDTRQQIASLRDESRSTHAQIDRDLTALRANMAVLEENRSEIVETLTRLQNQLDTVDATKKSADATLEHRIAEHKAEEKAMETLRSDVRTLKTENDQLMARLQSLRDQFQDNYHKNRQLLDKKTQ